MQIDPSYAFRMFPEPSAVYEGDEEDRFDYVHCPLCCPTVIYPYEDHQSPFFLFLSMENLKSFCSHSFSIPSSLDCLNTLVEKVKTAGFRVFIVLSTNERSDAPLVDLYNRAIRSVPAPICGKTAPRNSDVAFSEECKQGFNFKVGAIEHFQLELKTRADVIEYWLRDHGYDLHGNFIVLGKESDALAKRFGRRFVRVSEHFDNQILEKTSRALDFVCQESFLGLEGIEISWESQFYE